MKYQARLNGEQVSSSQEFERVLRAARKAALSFSNPDNNLLHIAIWEIYEETPEQDKIIHHDIILPEDLPNIDLNDKRELGITDPTKHTKIDIQKTKETRPLFTIGDHIMMGEDLYVICGVSEARATAEPVRRKKVTIQDKLTDKKATFSVKGRKASLSPYATNVLTEEQVTAELAKLDTEPKQSNEVSNTGDSGKSLPVRTLSKGKNRDGAGTPGHGQRSPVSDSSIHSGEIPKRKRGRPKGWRKLTSSSSKTSPEIQSQENSESPILSKNSETTSQTTD
jgi:hypothetical protein